MSHANPRKACGILASLFLLVLSAPAADFMAAVEAWQEKHEPTFEQANELALAGESNRSNKLLTELADQDGGGVAAFVIGNMLYRSDHTVSFRLHRRAWEAYPEEPMTNLEMAMQLHRQREYGPAIPHYRRALKGGMPEQFSCLLAECLLRTGNADEAVQAWRAARHERNHTAIDFAIYEIHGELMPHQRRGELIARIKAGETDKLVDLLLLDIRFDRDWWNAGVFEPGLEQDLKLAAELLGATDPRYQQLALYAKLAGQEDPSPRKIRNELAGARLIVDPSAGLPADSRLARALCEVVLRHEVAKAADLFKSLGPELRSRVAQKDRDALHLLCMLAAHAESTELEELDRIGWKEWQDPAFAVSYIADLVQNNKITRPDDPELLAAMQAKPENNHLCLMRLRLAGEKGATREMLTDAIKAEYRRLSTGMIIPDSYTLKGLYYLLAKDLGLAEETATGEE